MKSEQFTIFGDKEKQGAYLLFIELQKPVQIAFGSFRRGTPVPLAAGCYIYLGSALASRPGYEPLARRLIRHASRSGSSRPHPILNDLLRLLQQLDLACPATLPPVEKKLHWHIDYLLDRPETSIFHIAIFRSPDRLEAAMAAWLEECPETSSPAARLGAQDTRNSTHLLHCSDPENLLARLRTFIPPVLPDCGGHFP